MQTHLYCCFCSGISIYRCSIVALLCFSSLLPPGYRDEVKEVTMEALEGLAIVVVIILILGWLTWRAGSAQRDRTPEPPANRFETYQDDNWRYTPDESTVVDAD